MTSFKAVGLFVALVFLILSGWLGSLAYDGIVLGQAPIHGAYVIDSAPLNGSEAKIFGLKMLGACILAVGAAIGSIILGFRLDED